MIGLLIFALLIIVSVLNTQFHLGVAAFAAATIWGVQQGQSLDSIVQLLPVQLLIMIGGVSLLFQMAQENGAMKTLSLRITQLFAKVPHLLPFGIFALSALISFIGLGNIGTVAVMAPLALRIFPPHKLSNFAVTLLVVGGANAAALFPLSPSGSFIRELVSKEWQSIANLQGNFELTYWLIAGLCFLLIGFVHVSGFLIFGGTRYLLAPKETVDLGVDRARRSKMSECLLMAAILVFCAINLGARFVPDDIPAFSLLKQLSVNPGVIALILSVLLMVFRVAPVKESIQRLPWDTFLLIGGVFTLLGVMEENGSLILVTELTSAVSNKFLVAISLCGGASILSAFSSSSGVVMPLTIPLLSHALPEMNPTFFTTSLLLSSHMVDSSPLSSLGAICLAQCQGSALEKAKLFKYLLLWGLAMIPLSLGISVILLMI